MTITEAYSGAPIEKPDSGKSPVEEYIDDTLARLRSGYRRFTHEGELTAAGEEYVRQRRDVLKSQYGRYPNAAYILTGFDEAMRAEADHIASTGKPEAERRKAEARKAASTVAKQAGAVRNHFNGMAAEMLRLGRQLAAIERAQGVPTSTGRIAALVSAWKQDIDKLERQAATVAQAAR